MSYIILAVLITAIGLLALWRSVGKAKKLQVTQAEGGKVHGHGWALSLGTVIVLLVAFNALFVVWNATYQVPAGHVGIIYRFGAIVGLRVGASLLAGALLAWGGLGPWLIASGRVNAAGADAAHSRAFLYFYRDDAQGAALRALQAATTPQEYHG